MRHSENGIRYGVCRHDHRSHGIGKLEAGHAGDPKSLTAIELAASSAVIDFGFVYGNYNTMGFVMSQLIGSKKNNFASYYAGRAEQWEKALDKITKTAMESDT